jgi:glycosyltransferase involved in cell wall biosynthesis
MKVAIITDTDQSAIFRMATNIKKYNPEIQIKIVPFHPKGPTPKQINQLKEAFKWADLVDVQYWKSGAKAREVIKELWGTKKKVLTHHNPYNLHEEKWEDYVQIVTLNKTQQKELPQSRWIPHCIDGDFFKFNENYTQETTVNMTVARIEGKKGVYEVAKACSELGYKFLLVGRISKADYANRIIAEFGKGKFEFRNGVDENTLRRSYYESAVHVCNSVDNFESGTLPILESISCGVPVITRMVGHVPDIYNGKNLRILTGKPEDVAGIKTALRELMDNRPLRMEMRTEARKSVADRTHTRYASDYANLYKEII